ncbi:MAG: hypothetical protein IJD48_01525 [Clostridia bacterium]|nr:hypothetical protein [Clostridia bacterium]
MDVYNNTFSNQETVKKEPQPVERSAHARANEALAWVLGIPTDLIANWRSVNFINRTLNWNKTNIIAQIINFKPILNSSEMILDQARAYVEDHFDIVSNIQNGEIVIRSKFVDKGFGSKMGVERYSALSIKNNKFEGNYRMATYPVYECFYADCKEGYTGNERDGYKIHQKIENAGHQVFVLTQTGKYLCTRLENYTCNGDLSPVLMEESCDYNPIIPKNAFNIAYSRAVGIKADNWQYFSAKMGSFNDLVIESSIDCSPVECVYNPFNTFVNVTGLVDQSKFDAITENGITYNDVESISKLLIGEVKSIDVAGTQDGGLAQE